MDTRVTRIDALRRFDASAQVPARASVRAELGIRSFGANAFFSDAGGVAIEEHDELGSGAGHHEELYVVVSGAATFTIAGAAQEAEAGTLVYVPDPATRRGATATNDGTVILAVGGAPGEVFRQSPWEASQPGLDALAAGDTDHAVTLQRLALANRPDSPDVLYNLACIEARAGLVDDALQHLREVVRLHPDAATWAGDDTDFASILDRSEFRDIIGSTSSGDAPGHD